MPTMSRHVCGTKVCAVCGCLGHGGGVPLQPDADVLLHWLPGGGLRGRRPRQVPNSERSGSKVAPLLQASRFIFVPPKKAPP